MELLILAGIALFLVWRLRNVLGTRDGFEGTPKKPALGPLSNSRPQNHGFEVIDGGPDHDIVDHVPEGSDSAKALAAMKRVEGDFNVGEFLGGARGAYEMILMGFERGEIEELQGFLAEDIYAAFAEGIAARKEQGLTIDAEFIGVRELTLTEASFDDDSRLAQITVRYVGELTSVVKDAVGAVVEGSPTAVKRQKDVWTYARAMGSEDPNWQLVATDA